jgi:ferredoxin
MVELHDSQAGQRLDVAARLATPEPGTLIYCCGPQSLMEAVEAATAHWSEGSARFEWFTPRTQPQTEAGGFELVCAASGITLQVAAEQSILAALTQAGIEVPSSCEQGVCGTCECRILEGEAEHRDSILSAAERAAQTVLMACVSRAKTPRLVLDI